MNMEDGYMARATITIQRDSLGRPIRRRNRWTYVSHQWNGPVWRLDGTTMDLEYDSLSWAHCHHLQGGWVLYRNGHYDEPLSHYLEDAMEEAEEMHDGELWAALGGAPEVAA